MPALMAVSLGSPTNSRLEKSASRLHAISAGIALPRALRTCLVHAEVKQYGMVVDPGCMKCMDCVSVCPNDALYFGFRKPSLLAPKSNVIKRHYSLTWPEEIVGVLVFLGSFLAVRGVYALVPFLMALGCAAVTTFLALKTWRLFRARELSFYRFNLKSSGKIRKAGWVFAAFACVWIGLNAAQRLGPLSRVPRQPRV